MSMRPIQSITEELDAIDVFTERANLFRLGIQPNPELLYVTHQKIANKTLEEYRFSPMDGAKPVEAAPRLLRRALRSSILDALERAKFRVKRGQFRPIVTDLRSNFASHPKLRIYSSYELQVSEFEGAYFLCLDHRLSVHANLSLQALMQAVDGFQPLPAQRALIRVAGNWQEGRLTELGLGTCKVELPSDETALVPPSDVFLDLTREQILRLSSVLGVKPGELERSIKRLSFLTVEKASLARLQACIDFALNVAATAFPIIEDKITITLDPAPAVLKPPIFWLRNDLIEPAIGFDRVDATKRSKDVMTGLTGFGAYETPVAPVRLVLLTTHDRAPGMDRLIERLNIGSAKYRGAKRTFGGEFVVEERLITDSIEHYKDAVRDFAQDPQIDEVDVALAYMPKGSNPRNPQHPYYLTKATLLSEGLASQMVDETTVLNPDWRDLNLALNVYAKSGYVPWVLDEAMPGADLFIGLSTSIVEPRFSSERIMANANVFDSYGRWRFYRGDGIAFPFPERLDHYDRLVRDAIASYRAISAASTPLRSIHIHLTKSFSSVERSVLSAAVKDSEPEASINFVWVNPHHALRLYDLREGGTGEIRRATYLLQGSSSLYLATTGRNVFEQRGMGTPIPLQLTVWSESHDTESVLDQIAQQVLSLTRLNWSSTRNFCHEPITTKFAGDIAKRMAIFARDPRFSIHPRLRRVPWFL